MTICFDTIGQTDRRTDRNARTIWRQF